MNPFARIARRIGLPLALGVAFIAAETALQAAAPMLSPAFLVAPAMADDGGGGGGGGGGAGGAGGGGGGVVSRPRYGQPTIFDAFRGERRRRPARRADRPQGPRLGVELVASDVAEDDLARIREAGFTILGERRLGLLPAVTVRLRGPRALSERSALARLGRIVPGATVARNALYRTSLDRRPCPDATCFPYRAADWSVRSCGARGPVGLVDTGVDAGHPALAGAKVEAATTRSGDRAASSPEHGTEIGILLVAGRADATLVAVDAFHKSGAGDAADVFDLVAALDLLSARGVPVVNLSLAGPANPVLDAAGARATEKGMIVVAAAGNDGPKAGPRYPAAYPWAVAVTALDARDQVYARAGHGAHVAFAAPGVRLQLPDRNLAPGPVRSGTSYAAALVTVALSAGNGGVEALAARAVDLGAPGRDPVFGWGRLAPAVRCEALSPPAEREALAE